MQQRQSPFSKGVIILKPLGQERLAITAVRLGLIHISLSVGPMEAHVDDLARIPVTTKCRFAPFPISHAIAGKFFIATHESWVGSRGTWMGHILVTWMSLRATFVAAGIGSLINYQAHDMELKRPWHIFSVEVLWNAP